jgi:hypothetical protein
VTYSLATAIQFPSGLRATSRTGSVVLTRISSNLLPSSEYLLTVPSSEPVMKKPFCDAAQRRDVSMPSRYTYTSHDRSIVLLTVVHADWLIVRASCEHATVVVDSGRYEFLSIRCIGKVGCAGGIYEVSMILAAERERGYTHGPVDCAIGVLKP